MGKSPLSGKISLEIESEVRPARMILTEGWESRYYLQKTPVPVLEVEIDQPGILVTDFSW